MPLIKIESSSKSDAGKSDTDAAMEISEDTMLQEKESKSARRGSSESDSDSGGGRPSGTSALVLGLLASLALLAGVSLALVGSRWLESRQAETPGSGSDSSSVVGEPGGILEGGAGDPKLAAAQPLHPGPINGDYDRTANVAFVNGEAYTMRQLETAVRTARALGVMTGEVVPNYTDAASLGYQVRVLKRQIDVILMRQAMERDNIPEPPGSVDDLISAFLSQIGATTTDLQVQMIENSVSLEELEVWFENSRTTNAYVQQHLMEIGGDPTDPEQREARITQWLDEAWDTNSIDINFYDPDGVVAP